MQLNIDDKNKLCKVYLTKGSRRRGEKMYYLTRKLTKLNFLLDVIFRTI